MKDLWNYLKETEKPIVLYGMGNGADLIISASKKYGIKISGVFASDGFVRQKRFHGMPVTDYKAAKEKFEDMIVLVCFGTSLPAVIENIKRIAGECELYFPDVPVCGEGLFTADYYEARKDEFDEIYSLLADGTSKKVFKNIIDYKISGDINYLFACQTEEDEAYESFLKLSKDETYLDLGAYRGDTVLSFINRVSDYKEIIAVEPDEKSFKKLLDTAKGLRNVNCINAFIGENKSKINFNMNSSRGVGRAGTVREIETVSVDSLSLPPTFIKIDIEGGEAAAIAGAKETVKKYRPKMQIAAYHRTGDLIDIPKAVLKTAGNYKIYLRHNPCLPAWDTNFFFI